MINKSFLLSVLKSNNITSASSESDVKSFLTSISWPNIEAEEAVKFLRTQGWLFEEVYSKAKTGKETLRFNFHNKVIRPFISLFYKKSFTKAPSNSPVFNTFSMHSDKLRKLGVAENPTIIPVAKRPLVSRVIIMKTLKYILLLVIFVVVAYYSYLYRVDIYYIFTSIKDIYFTP